MYSQLEIVGAHEAGAIDDDALDERGKGIGEHRQRVASIRILPLFSVTPHEMGSPGPRGAGGGAPVRAASRAAAIMATQSVAAARS